MDQKALNYCTELNSFFTQKIANPEISYFEHTRVFQNNKVFMLNTRADYFHHFLEKKYSRPSYDIYTKSGVFLWAGIVDLLEYDDQITDMKINFNIDKGVSFVDVSSDYIDIYDFATVKDNCKIINFYLNNVDLLNKFCREYKLAFTTPLIDLAEAPLNIPLRPQKCTVNAKFNTLFCSITERELQCLELLSAGNTAKMTARAIGVSPRTVEKHLEHIKEKSGLHYKGELVNTYTKWKLLKSHREQQHEKKTF